MAQSGNIVQVFKSRNNILSLLEILLLLTKQKKIKEFVGQEFVC